MRTARTITAMVLLLLTASGCAVRAIDYDRKRILVGVLGLGVVFVSDKEGAIDLADDPTALDEETDIDQPEE